MMGLEVLLQLVVIRLELQAADTAELLVLAVLQNSEIAIDILELGTMLDSSPFSRFLPFLIHDLS